MQNAENQNGTLKSGFGGLGEDLVLDERGRGLPTYPILIQYLPNTFPVLIQYLSNKKRKEEELVAEEKRRWSEVSGVEGRQRRHSGSLRVRGRGQGSNPHLYFIQLY